MKTDLKDTTFIILVRLDSVERLENLIMVTNYLIQQFDTNIFVLEASHYQNGFLHKLLNKKITYRYIEDKDPVLFKTKYYNSLTKDTLTPIIAIWDTDIIAEKDAICNCIGRIRNKEADVALPFNGQCLDVPEVIRNIFINKKNIQTLFKNKYKMDLLYDRLLVGGAIFLNKEKYIQAGLDNENHYGWGNEDFDRFYKFQLLNYSIYKTDSYLYHLSHPRSMNSKYRSLMQMKKSSGELLKLKNLSPNELLLRVNKNL